MYNVKNQLATGCMAWIVLSMIVRTSYILITMHGISIMQKLNNAKFHNYLHLSPVQLQLSSYIYSYLNDTYLQLAIYYPAIAIAIHSVITQLLIEGRNFTALQNLIVEYKCKEQDNQLQLLHEQARKNPEGLRFNPGETHSLQVSATGSQAVPALVTFRSL